MQMEKNKALRPNGSLVNSIKKLWDVLKGDLMAMLMDFQQGRLHYFILILEPSFFYLRNRMQSNSAIPTNIFT
jgi:hypothetical protein